MAEFPFFLLLFLLIAILLRMDFVYYLVYVLAAVYILAHWWTRKGLAALRVTHHFTDHIFSGESAFVRISILNGSRLPLPWLRFDESAAVGLGAGAVSEVLPLNPGQEVELTYELQGRRRGVYQVGPGRLTVGDLFGFAEVQGKAMEPAPLVVYPRVIPLGQVALTSRSPYGTIKSRRPIFADPARPVGIRPYLPGDPVRMMDWKSSSRVGSLQVKKVEPAISLSTVILLDLNRASYSHQLQIGASEWAIVLAASLANHLEERRQAVGLGSNGNDAPTDTRCWMIPPRSGRTHLMKLLEWLARVELAETTPLAQWLPAASIKLPWGTTVVAITPSGGEDVCAGLARLLHAGLNPVLLAVEPHAQFRRIQERAQRLGFPAYQIAGEDDLRRWQAAASGGIAGGAMRGHR